MVEITQSFETFTPRRFLQWVHFLSGTNPKVGAPQPDAQEADSIDQARYLANYIGRDLGATALLVERPYIDRHYIEEYTGYYARTLFPPSPHTARIHFFSSEIDENRFQSYLTEIAENRRTLSEVEEELATVYLGYSVIRPIPDVPIGRTILRTVGVTEVKRNYRAALSTNDAHIAGLSFRVCGLPFQQQDQGVGACATTAVWSALSGVLRQVGNRPPTPLEVTNAAHQVRGRTRQIPAKEGLEPRQMAAAVAAFDLTPTFFSSTDAGDPVLFGAALKCYLSSGIPVILHVAGENSGGHAVTAVGFSETANLELMNTLDLRVRSLRRVYFHDDRLGPYARYKPKCENEEYSITMRPTAPGDEWAFDFMEELRVYHAIAPVYPKLRMSATGLFGVAAGWVKIIRRAIAEENRRELHVDTRFELSGRLLADILTSSYPADRAVAFAQSAFLSRYVGVVDIFLGDELLLRAICDATDVNRNRQPTQSTIAVIPYSEELRDYLAELVNVFPEIRSVIVV